MPVARTFDVVPFVIVVCGTVTCGTNVLREPARDVYENSQVKFSPGCGVVRVRVPAGTGA